MVSLSYDHWHVVPSRAWVPYQHEHSNVDVHLVGDSRYHSYVISFSKYAEEVMDRLRHDPLELRHRPLHPLITLGETEITVPYRKILEVECTKYYGEVPEENPDD